MTIITIIKNLGGEQFLAYKLKVHQVTIKRWSEKGIPRKYWKKLIALSKGKLTADAILSARLEK